MSQNNVVIRKAQHHDLIPMAQLLEQLFTIEDDFTFDLNKQTHGLRLLLKVPTASVFVAKIKNRVVGMITMQSLVSTAMGEHVGLIEDLVVSADYRGKGIGKSLLSTVINESDRRGYTRLSLGADLRNVSAISFYHTFGFESSSMGLMYRC
jgi:ribosomal protein S18 acetylase RimI-like enzyme